MSASPRRTSNYDRAAEDAASIVLRRYSSSFRFATELLGPRVRQHCENIYAWVRIAHEMVNGEAGVAGLTTGEAERLIREFEAETDFALEHGYSSNLIVHAFALTARETGFDGTLTAPVFESLRADLGATVHDQASFDRYVFCSAEVVARMCLRVFLEGTDQAQDDITDLEAGARALGAAFQKLDLLANISDDVRDHGQTRFPDVSAGTFDDVQQARLLEDIDDELRTSGAAIPKLPADCRRGVVFVQAQCMELATRLRETPSDQLVTRTVQLPNAVKVRLVAAAAAGWVPRP